MQVCYNGGMEKKFFKHKITNLITVQKIVTVHYQELLKGYASEDESHDFWELIYADRKSVTVVVNGRDIPLAQGEAIFVRPNAPHFVKCVQDTNIFIISFECRSESMGVLADRVIKISKERRGLFEALMNEASNTFRIPDFDPALNKLELLPSPELGGEQIIKNSLEILIIYLLRSENGRTQRYFVSKIEDSAALEDAVLSFLTERIYGTLSLDELCEALHYGKTRLCTFFKQKTGKSIYQTYLNMKIDEAKKLLRTELSVTEISMRLCFSSPSHFSDTFKNLTGRSPAEYAESIKK